MSRLRAISRALRKPSGAAEDNGTLELMFDPNALALARSLRVPLNEAFEIRR